ncbi:energy transducer TonB family protein [Novosphingobium terrae]|uniref:energy transducer TonB family protein n=1 Tax=Novosphingobium terrae TaxID=2726189 RepID=UPI00197F903D|nr:TonB family protein [Novosphingobium terrae]
MTALPPFSPPHADRMTHGPYRSMRGIELAVTCVVHVFAVAVAALALGWQGAGDERLRPAPQSLIIGLHQPDTPHDRAQAIAGAKAPRPAPLSAKAAAFRPDDPLPTPQEAEEAPVTTNPGGHSEPPAQEAQSYRRALMAQLEAQRRYPESGLLHEWQGSGAVLFRIERSGRLLEAVVAASTGHKALDKAALGIVQRAAPFPAIPDSLPDELAITLPIAFLIDHHGGTQP